MNILTSKLTHNEILTKTGIQISKRQLSQARMGREPALSNVRALLSDVSPDRISTLEAEARDIEIADMIIKAGKELLTYPFGQMYFEKYRKYIDMKVDYNKKAITPRNHSELIAVHQKVRIQHEEAKKLLEMPEFVLV